MPEIPGFELRALRLEEVAGFSGEGDITTQIRTVLVGMWNARSAADMAR